MQVSSMAIVDGVIHDKYGQRGRHFNEHGMPTYSWPFHIEDAPAGTVSFAAILYDIDSFVSTGGFIWIHWVIANLHRDTVGDNESQSATDFLQGANSNMSVQGGQQSRELSSYYGGMAPPDVPHQYTLQVFALDTDLDLQNGFLMNQMLHQMEGHVLETAKVFGIYYNE